MTESFGESQRAIADFDRTFAEPVEDTEPRSQRVREGLPAGFRMRHDAHYVDQLTAVAGAGAVRHIPIVDIATDGHRSDEDPTIDLAPLIDSIKHVGVLQPLLVSTQRGSFQLIAGLNRLRAAAAAGMQAVPCIVQEVDDEKAEVLRSAAAIEAATLPVPELTDDQESVAGGLSGLADVIAAASACAALAERAGRSVTGTMASALLKVELARAARVATAAAVVLRAPVLSRAPLGAGTLLSHVADAARAIRRATGVEVDYSLADEQVRVLADERLTVVAVLGTIDALLGLVAEMRPVALRVVVRGVTVRPAVVIEMSQTAAVVPSRAAGRFFESHDDHPCGTVGGLQLAAAARIVRAHGGRVEVTRDAPAGCTVTFVLPHGPRKGDSHS